MMGDLINGCVYVAKTVGAPYAKIGMTVCGRDDAAQAVAVRVKKLSKGCPLPLALVHFVHVVDAPGIEAGLLRRFAEQRIVGEWVRVRSARVVVRELERLAKEWRHV
jgi:hypothetical protein